MKRLGSQSDPDRRAPTMVDVAKLAEVSLATVSAVINDSAPVSADRKKRVLDAIRRVGYQTNAIARSLKTGSTKTIGLMIADITNPFFTAVIHSIQEVAYHHGYGVMLCCSDEDPEKERLHLRLMSDRMVDALIIATAGETPPLRALIDSRRKPVVLIDRLLDGVATDAVVIDNVAAARDAVRYLVSLGHRRIGLITGKSTLSTARERYQGYCQALAEAGIAIENALVGAARFGSADGYGAAMGLLSLAERPTAIFASNNLSGIGLMRGIKDSGLRCPADISVACFDDFEWADVFEPRLTTLVQPTQAIGAQAMAIVLEHLQEGAAPRSAARVVRMRAQLRIRDSCVMWPPPGLST
ncbi:LacI family transcriptional regulator [Verminephrobacter eiseniae]|nr:LacI family transcriptional regulator [Verminephrobacter eiseniae]MCW5295102.1 LacI family transcriptional regulator [Verminephrobacter eiseniae]MCW8185044.1 LacI family transcriptional regulator [Verminephrobacter eiseniae]MCW8223746.1 LacI family transcriptional regulator [Verminephrobacter eiseniae]MCW8234851.1 LacI family transcriptional regulator [Verminephrobacter eiseniae]